MCMVETGEGPSTLRTQTENCFGGVSLSSETDLVIFQLGGFAMLVWADESSPKRDLPSDRDFHSWNGCRTTFPSPYPGNGRWGRSSKAW